MATNFGNSGPGIVFGPGQNNSDFAVIKRTPLRLLGESSNVEFRTEFFNVLYHRNSAIPTPTSRIRHLGRLRALR